MSEKYKEMWQNLDLNISNHNKLLEVLGESYNEIYLFQKYRPKAMKYFDFVVSEAHGLRIKELLEKKKNGSKIVGTFCIFVPEEIILAFDSVCVGLCAGAEIGYELSEMYLPRNTCPLIKSFFGFTLAKVCPYVESCDLIVGETTCDGKKKSYEIFDNIKNTYIMEIPQLKNNEDFNLLLSEYHRFIETMEKFTNKKLNYENLLNAIKIVDKKRAALQKMMELRAKSPSPISGKDALLVNQISFYDDPVRFTENVEKLNDELEKIESPFKNKKRILIAGCPMALPNWKIPHIVENLGGIIVGEESCIGMRNIRNNVSTNSDTVEGLVKNIAERYFNIDCACFTPNNERINHIKELAENLKIDGVIQYSLQFCTPYLIETYKVEKELEKLGIPVLNIETDYTQEDIGQLSTRIQAFMEIL